MSARCRACERITLGKCEHCHQSYCQDHLVGAVCRGCEQISNVACTIELLSKKKVRLAFDEVEVALSCAQALKLQKLLDQKAAELRAALDNKEFVPPRMLIDWL